MDEALRRKIEDCNDLELAILVSLVAQQHCIFSTQGSKRSLQQELRSICISAFGLHPVIVECTPSTSVDDFSEGILVNSEPAHNDDVDYRAGSGHSALAVGFNSQRRSSERYGSNTLDERRIADVIILTDLDLATEHVQVQALELLRTKRIFTRAAMHIASKAFMILAISSGPGARMSKHLNDLFCMSHLHDDEDGYHTDGQLFKNFLPTFSYDDITTLRALAAKARHTPEIAAYIHNIVVFMRQSRYIQGGVTAIATMQLRLIAKALAPLHGLDFVTPSLVALAARKIYPHRLRLVTAETERSLQWGSNPEAVKRLLAGFTVEDAIEDVLVTVEMPL